MDSGKLASLVRRWGGRGLAVLGVAISIVLQPTPTLHAGGTFPYEVVSLNPSEVLRYSTVYQVAAEGEKRGVKSTSGLPLEDGFVRTSVTESSDDIGPLVYHSHVADDPLSSSNNDNDHVDPGESIDLAVWLANQGLDTADAVTATISTSDPNVSFLSSTVGVYDSVLGWAYESNSTMFRFEVDEDTPCGHIIVFDLEVSASVGGPWPDSFSVPVSCSSPGSPSDPSPADDEADVDLDPSLAVTVSDPDGDDLTVTFYGRELHTPSADSFSIVVLPDTQYYTCDGNPLSCPCTPASPHACEGEAETFIAQTQWIVDNVEQENIAFVPHVGDLVQAAGWYQAEWDWTDQAMGLLESPLPGIPYGIAPGNHDLYSIFGVGERDGDSYFNQYFGAQRFLGRSYYGGHFGATNTNHYVLFDAGDLEFIAIFLDYRPGTDPQDESAVLAWADNLMRTHYDRRAIVIRHEIIDAGGKFHGRGQQIYEALKRNPNLFLMLCGHIHGQALWMDGIPDDGKTVYAVLSNYQNDENGGDGWLRVLAFSPSTDEITIRSYSPSLDEENWGSGPITVPYDMHHDVEVIGTISGMPSGSRATASWENRLPGTTYEWYVEVSDGVNSTISPVWSFSTEEDVIPPTNPTSVTESSGVVDDTWQGTVDDPAFNWSGASDTGSGVAGYYVYWGTDPAGTSSASQVEESYDPPTVPSPSVYYLRVQTEDNAGNRSAWQTLFTFRYDASPPTGPTSVTESSSVVNDAWQATVDDPAFVWSGASDAGSGVAGYSVYWGTDPGGTSSVWRDTPSYDPSAVSSPSVHYLRVQTEDFAGNTSAWQTLFTFRYDASAPSNPTSFSSSHALNTWSNDSTIDIGWTGASDGTGSGIGGYSYQWSTSSSTLPDTTVDTAGGSTTSPPLSSSNSWYFHIRTQDNAGNWSTSATHYGPFRIDVLAPTNPTSFSSSPAPDTWSNDSTIDIGWTGASDGTGSGIDGYSYQWSMSSSTLPDTTVDTAGGSTTSPPLSSSNSWYFHIRTQDNVGNWTSSAAHYGPFKIDTTPPSNPTLVSPGCAATSDVWQNTCPDPSFSWAGASDAGSGVAGYYVYWGTDPAGTSSAWHVTDEYDPSAVDDPSVHYLRVQTEDNAGNRSAWQTLFTFRYDASPPTGPTSVTESSSVVNDAWQATVDDPAFVWSGASDAGSGVAGYSVYWGTDAGGASSVWRDTPSYDPSAVSSPSVHYLRVQTEDFAGNTSVWQTLFTFRYDASAPSNPTSFSSSHALNTWSNDSTIEIGWTGASDGTGSGIGGYSYQWSMSSSTLPDTTVDTAGGSTTSPELSDGSNWYFHIRTQDNVGNWSSSATHYGPFKIDTSPPSNPTLVSPGCAATSDVWQNTCPDPSFSWTGASGTGSGVAGYSVYWGTDPGGTSGVWRDTPNYDPSAVSSPSVHHLRVQTEDFAGNTSAWQTLFTFRYDASAPSNPTSFSSSHALNTWSNDSTIDIGWTGASDGTGSGIGGYSYQWSTSSSTLPDTTVDTAGGSTTSPVLSEGSNWYFHIRAQDNVGNWSSTAAHYGPFRIDVSAPTGPTLVTESSGVVDNVWQGTVEDPSFSWAGASDTGSGVAGYYVYWGTDPNGTSTAWQTYTTYDPVALSSPSVHYLRVQTEDVVGNTSAWQTPFTFRYDASPPTGPTSVAESSGVADNTWQGAVGDPAFSWTGAGDTGSGVAGYYVYWGTDPAGTSSAWQATADYDPAVVSDPSVHYLRVQTQDHAGNTSAWQTLFTFRYDASAPINPLLSSPSHEAGAWSNVNIIEVSWSGASDGIGSGVYGFSFAWTSSPDTLPDTSVDTTTNSASSAPLPDSEGWYFHLRTVDNAANWSVEAVHLGPFRLERTPPTSFVSGLPDSQTAMAFPVSWGGEDSGIASGVAAYDVQFRIGSDADWTDWLIGTPLTSATFGPLSPVRLRNETTYYFRCRAVDYAGNEEAYPTGDGDAWTTVYVYTVFMPIVMR